MADSTGQVLEGADGINGTNGTDGTNGTGDRRQETGDRRQGGDRRRAGWRWRLMIKGEVKRVGAAIHLTTSCLNRAVHYAPYLVLIGRQKQLQIKNRNGIITT